MKAARAGHLCTVQFLISKGKESTSDGLYVVKYIGVYFLMEEYFLWRNVISKEKS